MAVAVCPKCRCQLSRSGEHCPNDECFGVDPKELEDGNKIVGRPLGGSFVALRKLGQGGMGTVYEGRQIQFDRLVAIKVLSSLHLADEQIVARFVREAKSIARVIHPNVVQLIDSGVENGEIAYIVMEHVKGVELSNIPPAQLTTQFIVHITHQVLNALAEAHAMNVIHRDLKPDNIMITQEDGDPQFVKVLDFGLAALVDGAKITVSGQALGTPWYMSPEQASASKVTAASDIYSLGCVLYELATSKPPFPGTRPFNVMMQHVNAEVPPIIARQGLEISDGMKRFIMKCLEKDPMKRFTTANEALNELSILPEWLNASQVDPAQSLKMSMMQLSEIGRLRSDVTRSDVVSSLYSSSDNAALRRSGDLLIPKTISRLLTIDGTPITPEEEALAAQDTMQKMPSLTFSAQQQAVIQSMQSKTMIIVLAAFGVFILFVIIVLLIVL